MPALKDDMVLRPPSAALTFDLVAKCSVRPGTLECYPQLLTELVDNKGSCGNAASAAWPRPTSYVHACGHAGIAEGSHTEAT